MSCLKYRDDDGLLVEPEWYAPILPMLLVNGSRGIGTGYSTFIPQFNPVDLKNAISEWLETGSGLEREFVPYYSKFRGSIRKVGPQEYECRGVFKMEGGDTLVITELPVETWTMDFREKLEKMLADGVIRDFSDTSTDTDVLVKIKLGSAGAAPVEKLLVEKIKLTNMHAFNSQCVIHKYESVTEILREFCGSRLGLYRDRIAYLLKELRDKLPYHENVVRFIRQQCEDKPRPELRKKTGEECDRLLSLDNFVKIKDSYDYLLNLPIASLTLKHALKHEKDLEDLKHHIVQLEKTTAPGLWKEELGKLKI
jgi:DNA topoisomerase-2